MRETDDDIEALERLLGRARADYRALRYEGTLPRRAPRSARTVSLRAVAVAASVLLVVTGITLGSLDWFGRSDPARYSQLSMPGLETRPLSLRPTGPASLRPSIDRARLRISLSLPSRPKPPEGPKG